MIWFIIKRGYCTFNSDNFAMIRPCRSEIEPYSPNVKYKNRRGKYNHNDKKINDYKIKLVMIGKKSVEHFVGKWRIHSIMNLTTFDRIHSALQRRGTLPLEKLLLAQSPPVEKPLPVLPEGFPIRKNRLMKSRLML